MPSTGALTIAQHTHDAMVAHAIRGFPNEACGLFAGPPGTTSVDTFYPMRNAAASSQIYQLDGTEMLAVERQADDAGSRWRSDWLAGAQSFQRQESGPSAL